jgi:hypothetical protein
MRLSLRGVDNDEAIPIFEIAALTLFARNDIGGIWQH